MLQITLFGVHNITCSLCILQVARMLYLPVVFMGSRKYQNDNDFDVYVSEHGGSSNAFTDCEKVATV